MDDKIHKRLTYCKVCKYRKRDEELGLICSLSSKVADFESICGEYEFDPNEFVSLKKNIEEIVKNKNEIAFKEGYDFLDPETIYYETYFDPNTYIINDQEEVILKRTLFTRIITSVIFLGIIIFILNLTIIRPTENKIGSMILGSLIIVFIIYIAYRHFFQNVRKIKLDKNGIEIIYKVTYSYEWSEILDINVLTSRKPTKGGSSKLKTIIIDFISGKILEYPVQVF